MPLLVTHTAIGVVVKQLGFKSIFHKRWKTLVFIAVLANLPDIDFLLGLIFAGNGYAWHYGFTHSIFFALVAGFFISRGGGIFLLISQKVSWLSWRIPKVNFLFCFSLISSHGLADFISNGKIALFFHPLGANLPVRHLGVAGLAKIFVNYTFQEVKIIVGCVIIIVFIQLVKIVLKKFRVLDFVLWSHMFGR